MISVPLFRYALTAMRRDRVFQLMLVMLALAASLSLFLGSASTIEQKQYTLALAGTTLRLVATLGLIVFISFFMRRAFESREMDYLLASPVTRHRLLLSFSAAFVGAAVFLAGVIAFVLFVISMKLSPGLLVWSASVVVELAITAMMALFFACVLQSATISALCSVGLYALARLLGMMIGIVNGKLVDTGWVAEAMNFTVGTIAVVVPRFDLMAQSAWLVYGQADGFALWLLPVQMIVFCALFFFCAAFDLRRTQF
jgi:ABC-type transport system involved in multi-copper enzyme maturation permease subunit